MVPRERSGSPLAVNQRKQTCSRVACVGTDKVVVGKEYENACGAAEHHVCLCFPIELVLCVLKSLCYVLIALLRIFSEPRISSVRMLREFTVTAGIVATPNARQEPIAHHIAICLRLLPVDDLVVLIHNVLYRGSLDKMRQDQRQTLLDKSRDLVTIDSVPIHDSDHPQILDTCQVFLVEVGILIDFPHLWNESSSCLMGDPLYHLLHWPFSLVLKLDWFDVGSSLQRHGFLVLPYVDPSEVRGLILEVKHANLVRIPRRAAAVWQLSCPFKMLNIATFFF